MSDWLIPRSSLTQEQLRAVELPMSEHRVVFGPAGSGKTQVLVHRADHLRTTYAVTPERFHIFVFTNVLKDYIRSSLKWVDLPTSSVSTFDRWCRDIHKKHLPGSLPWNAEDKTYDFAAIRRGVLRLVKSRPDLRGFLDFALVDEGQDLEPLAFEILSVVSKHVTVFVDHQQQIFEDGASEDEILKTLGLPRRNATLLIGYRNSSEVARLASYFVSDLSLRGAFLSQIRNTQAARERPLCFMASSHEEEMNRLADLIRQRLTMNQHVGILLPKVRQVHGYEKGLAERKVKVQIMPPPRKSGVREEVPFDSSVPKIATYHSAKGLTFDSILLPSLTEASFERTRGLPRQRLLFVGIVRATKWAYLSMINGSEIEEFSILEEAAANGHLVIQRGPYGKPPRGEDEDYSVL